MIKIIVPVHNLPPNRMNPYFVTVVTDQGVLTDPRYLQKFTKLKFLKIPKDLTLFFSIMIVEETLMDLSMKFGPQVQIWIVYGY